MSLPLPVTSGARSLPHNTRTSIARPQHAYVLIQHRASNRLILGVARRSLTAIECIPTMTRNVWASALAPSVFSSSDDSTHLSAMRQPLASDFELHAASAQSIRIAVSRTTASPVVPDAVTDNVVASGVRPDPDAPGERRCRRNLLRFGSGSLARGRRRNARCNGWRRAVGVPAIRKDTSQGRLRTHHQFLEAQEADAKANDRFISSLAGGRSQRSRPDSLSSMGHM